jgi:hypothetical protein
MGGLPCSGRRRLSEKNQGADREIGSAAIATHIQLSCSPEKLRLTRLDERQELHDSLLRDETLPSGNS